MDYSASSVEDPAGASPWGSSPVASPQHARTNSYGTTEIPPSPTPYTPTRNTSYSQEDSIGGGSMYSRPESSAGESTTEGEEQQRPDTAESVAIDPQSALAGHQQQQQAAAQPQRYHQNVRAQQQPQQAQQQASQYKLQAKITGLERTGRKDPILRFDVHVCSYASGDIWFLICSIDQLTQVSNYSIPRCPKNPFRVCQACRPPHIIKP